MYKGKLNVASPYCGGAPDACVLCSEEKIKTSPGDSVSLCDVDCGGVSKVANAERTGVTQVPVLRTVGEAAKW